MAQEQRLPEVMSWMAAWHHARQRGNFRQDFVWTITTTERPFEPIDLQSGMEDTTELQGVIEQLRNFTVSKVIYVEMHCQMRQPLLFPKRCLVRRLQCFNQNFNFFRRRCLWWWIQGLNHYFYLLRARFSLFVPPSITRLGICAPV